MDGQRFDSVTRSLVDAPTRRSLLRGLLAGLGAAALTGLGLAPVSAQCTPLGQRCTRVSGKCCGGAECRGSRCRCRNGDKPCRKRCIRADRCCTSRDCGGGTCRKGNCFCRPDQKRCEGGCIPDDECCGGCPGNSVCCRNLGQCKDIRNDPNFCGNCVNGRCSAGEICANADCARTCTTVGGEGCPTGCTCSNRLDPAHLNQKVCAHPGPGGCDFIKECTTDASCAPATEGFREICVSGLCPDKNVCADACR
jgi:hypothetical protein